MKSLKPLSLLILIASALLLSDGTLGSANAQSESPSIRNSQNQEAKDQQSQTQKPPTPTGISVSIAATPTEAMPTPKGNQPNGNSQSWNDWFWQNLTGILLVLVGIWAARIAIGTLDQIAEQTRAGTIAANAAKQGADTATESADTGRKALLLQFRPKLIVRNFAIPLRAESGNATYYFFRNELVGGQFYVANIGAGAATITESLCKVYLQKGGTLPMRRPYEGENGNNPVLGKIKAGGRLTAIFQSDDPLPISQLEIGMMGYDFSPSWTLYIMGWIEYSDDLGFGRRTAFCRQFDPKVNRFVPVTDPDYEHAE